MKISKYGEHWLTISETNIDKRETDKIHLIKLNFVIPTEEKIDQVLKNFSSTNRFIIESGKYVKFYNDILKGKRKYYIENTSNVDLITFMKRNNKVILNISNLMGFEYEFIIKNPDDILRNVECIMMKQDEYENHWKELLIDWNGNVLIKE